MKHFLAKRSFAAISGAALILCALVAASALAQTAKTGQMLGQWKLNIAKSDFGGGPKVMGRVIDVTSDTPESIKFSVSETESNGMNFNYKFSGPADGKDYPIEGSSTTYSYTEENGVITETQKDGDGTVTKGTFSLSATGKQAIWIYTITDPQGGVIHQKLVYDRVK